MVFLYRCIFLSVLLLWLPIYGQAAVSPYSVGVVFSTDNTLNRETFKAFSDTLQAAGYGAESLKFFVQKPHADMFSWANSTRRAEAAGIDVLVTFGSPITRVALRETTSLRVIFAGVFTPLEVPVEGQRMVTGKDLKQASGIYSEVPLATLVKAYAEVHGPGTLTAVFHQGDIDAFYQLGQIEQAAAIYGLKVNSVHINPSRLTASLAQLTAGSDVFFVSNVLFGDEHTDKLLAHIRDLKRPVLGLGSGMAEKGALFTLENDHREQGAVAAQQLLRVLEGESVNQLSRQKPRKVDLVVNLPACKSLNIKVPFDLLSSATRIIR